MATLARSRRSLLASGLCFAQAEDDSASLLSGKCGGGATVVDRKVVTIPEVSLFECVADEASLTGKWEDTAGASGTFELTMRSTGQTFGGVRRYDEDGLIRAFSDLLRPSSTFSDLL